MIPSTMAYDPPSSNYIPLVIVGNGPSALFLSFMLHGNVPYYDPITNGPHPDRDLHNLLLPYVFDPNLKTSVENSQNNTHPNIHNSSGIQNNHTTHQCSLLNAVNNENLLDYIRMRYSSFYSVNTNPVALLIDTLIASDESNFASLSTKESRIYWDHNSLQNSQKIKHVVFGSSPSPGGQWSSKSMSLPGNTDYTNCCGIEASKSKPSESHDLAKASSNSVKPSTSSNPSNTLKKKNIRNTQTSQNNQNDQSLSYAEMLSLPGYSFTEYYSNFHRNSHLEDYSRPKRERIAEYYTEYPKKLNLSDSFCSGTIVTSIDSVAQQQPVLHDQLSNQTNPRFSIKYIYLHSPFEHHTIESSFVVLASGVFEKPLKQLQKTFDNIRRQNFENENIDSSNLGSPIGCSLSAKNSSISLCDMNSKPISRQSSGIFKGKLGLSEKDPNICASSCYYGLNKSTTANSSTSTLNSISTSPDYVSAFNSTASSTKILSMNGISREDLRADIQSREPSVLVPQCPPSTSPSTVLVIGSGVSAAEAINKASQQVNVIHVFRWCDDDPCPLKRMSKESFPEYNMIYRMMKKSVKRQNKVLSQILAKEKHDNSQYLHVSSQDLEALKMTLGNHSYIGIANAQIESFSPCGKIVLAVEANTPDCTNNINTSPSTAPTSDFIIETLVSRIKICTGRSGSLEYLSPNVRKLAGLRSVNADLGSVSKTFLATVFAEKQQQEQEEHGLQQLQQAEDSSNTDEEPPSGVASPDRQDSETLNNSSDESISIEPHEFGSCCPQSPVQTVDKKFSTSQMSNLRLGKGLYAVGSLTGETLVRFMLGGCIWVAQDIMKRASL